VETKSRQADRTIKKYIDAESVARRTLLFEKYVLPHVNLVYKLCINYTANQEDIDDNYVEVLTNFYKYIETYDPSKSIQTWLHIVTKRYIMDADSKRSHMKFSDNLNVSDIGDKVLGDDEINTNHMSEENYRQFYNDDVLQALDSLEPIYKEALLLQQAGYKLHEIMDITYKNGSLKTRNIETVKSRLFLAKKKMRQMITRDGEKRTN
jgi:RNA polymerase sigma factor (sigma-70 family)